jgi:predicted ATPase
MRTLYVHKDHQALAHAHGQEPGAVAHMYLALARWFLGYPDQAVASMDEALAIAARTPHPLTLTMVVNFAGDLGHFRRDRDAQREYAARTVALALEHNFPLWLGGATSSTGWALVERGMLEDGINQIRRSLAMTRATGAMINQPFMLSKLAAAYLRAGAIADGLQALEDATALVRTNLDRYWAAELHRLRGELLLALPDPQPEAADVAYQEALAMSRAQRAKSLELRAAQSIATLRRTQGRSAEGAGLLRGVYEWFTEGFATADLLDARRLLAELG